jgi:acetate kinase
MSILVFNAGSTSLKFGLFDDQGRGTLLSGEIDWADGNRGTARMKLREPAGEECRQRVSVPDDQAAANCAIQATQAWLAAHNSTATPIRVVGHRVVHGGAEFRESALVSPEVIAGIRRLAELAPLHNPPALRTIEMVQQLLPQLPQVVVFDTTLYANLPPRAHVYPLPYAWYEQWGIRKFGFHGISHAYCARRAAELLGRDLAELRIVSCHLGGGCSATVFQNGEPAATTLGFSPLDGLMMGTRPGAIDPGIIVYLQREHGVTLEEIDRALNYSSGLLGVSGLAPDLAVIEAAAAQGNPRATLAFTMFADRVRSAIGALAVTVGGLDVLLFTDRAGVGSPALRAAVCEGLQCLGVHLDPARNEHCVPDSEIAARESSARILVINTREELMIAREAKRVVTTSHSQGNPPITSAGGTDRADRDQGKNRS